jgi:hypothetical protein
MQRGTDSGYRIVKRLAITRRGDAVRRPEVVRFRSVALSLPIRLDAKEEIYEIKPLESPGKGTSSRGLGPEFATKYSGDLGQIRD